MTWSTTPTPEELRELSTPELGLIILKNAGADLNTDRRFRGHEQAHDRNQEPDAQHLLERLGDAWAWLTANGLVGPHVDINHKPSEGWCRVTDKGRQVAEENSLTTLMADQRLPEDSRCWSASDPLAVFEAMKQVEVRLRELSGAGNDEIGTKLARHALDPEEHGERLAISHLFAGALGAFKNPTSHRIVDFDDPALAADAVLLADLLMRMLDQAVARVANA